MSLTKTIKYNNYTLTKYFLQGDIREYEDEVENIGDMAFAGCSLLQSANFSICTTIGSSAFWSCTSLQSVDFPNCSTIGSNAFRNCTSLQSINFPNCTSIGSRAFSYCTSLQSVSFPSCITISNQAFYSCTSLQSVYLLSTSICTLSNSNAFNYTPLSQSSYLGYFGSIYVPRSLLASYKTATNWTYYSSRFIGI